MYKITKWLKEKMAYRNEEKDKEKENGCKKKAY